MPAPTPNRGQLIGAGKVGYNAVTAEHPVSEAGNLSSGGSLTVTQTNALIEKRSITGKILVRAPGVRIWNCRADSIDVQVKDYPNASADIRYSTFGKIDGLKIEGDGRRTVGIGAITLYRCNVFGAIDLVQLHCSTGNKLVENWFHDLYDPPDPSQASGDAHSDPVQFISSGNCVKITDTLIQGNRYDSWIFQPGQTCNENGSSAYWGTIGGDRATSGLALIKTEGGGNPPVRVWVRDNYVDGNYSQLLYVTEASGQSCPTEVFFFDNIIKKRAASYGQSSPYYVNLGTNCTITEGRNLDADTGAEITLAKNKYGTRVKTPGPSSSYPSFFTGTPDPDPNPDEPPPPDPNPSVVLLITSPDPDSVHTSGTVLFTGGADVATGDSNTNYNYFNFYIESENLPRKHLDKDQATNVTGFTIGATATGPTFTARDGIAYTPPAAVYVLTIEGERKDGTKPTKQINVTFGTIVAPTEPPDATIAGAIDITMDVKLDVVTTTGGVPADLVKGGLRLVNTTENYSIREDTGREVFFNKATSQWEEV